jgi:branched-chain amino acid transport system substrate-binding protein
MSLAIQGAVPWMADLPHAANRRFVDQHLAYLGHLPDPFAVLGYDSASLLAQAIEGAAIEGAGGATQERDRLRAALLSATVTSPRGYLSMDAQTQHLTGPLYLHRLRRQGQYVEHQAVEHLDAPLAAMHAARNSNSLRTGWLNPYLCV